MFRQKHYRSVPHQKQDADWQEVQGHGRLKLSLKIHAAESTATGPGGGTRPMLYRHLLHPLLDFLASQREHSNFHAQATTTLRFSRP